MSGSAEMLLPEHTALLSVARAYGAPPITEDAPHVMACAEDTGGAAAVMPVLRALHERNVGTTILAAGHGLRILQESGSEYGLRPYDPQDNWPEVPIRPSGLLLAPSVGGRLERGLLSRFPSMPAVVVEDYYDSCRGPITCAAEMGLLPPIICTIDQEAKRLIRRRFPELPVQVEITGSPAFDPYAREDVAAVRAQSRERLGISQEQKFIPFFIPCLGEASLRLAGEVADAFRQMGDGYVFAPRKHPSDTIQQPEYDQLFDGVPTLDTDGVPADDVANAADLVIAHRSTTVLREAVRQQPTITLTTDLPPGFTFPVVDAGASQPARPAELPALIPELLAGTSLRCAELRRNMLNLRADGVAAARVADVVCRAMLSSQY